MFYAVDRIYRDVEIAVLILCEGSINDENEKKDVPLCELPENTEVNHILLFKDGIYTIDFEETKKRKANIESRFKKLFKKNKL